MNLIYENYHSNRRIQKRVMGVRDFTYRNVLFFLQKYPIEGQKILDIGCGVGTLDLFMANNGGKVLGIDISKNGINTAKRNAIKLGLQRDVKFMRLDFPKAAPAEKFSKIVCSEVLEHIKNDKSAVKTMSKLLKKGGIIIASSPSKNAPLYRLGLLNNFDRKVGHLRRYSVKSFEKLFVSANLDVLEIKKTEGLLRNFLFTNSFGGFLLRILNKWPLSEFVTFIDDLTVSLFGESNIYLVAQKK